MPSAVTIVVGAVLPPAISGWPTFTVNAVERELSARVPLSTNVEISRTWRPGDIEGSLPLHANAPPAAAHETSWISVAALST